MKSEQDNSEALQNLLSLTPRNITIIELIKSEQRFVYDMKHILKVIHTFIPTVYEISMLLHHSSCLDE